MNTLVVVMLVTTYIVSMNAYAESATRWESLAKCEEVAAKINSADGKGEYEFSAVCFEVPSNSVGLGNLDINR